MGARCRSASSLARTRSRTPRGPGGERILALGVDHRLRLFDRGGALLDELAEHGLAPWQLRMVGRGESLAAAVVLAQPTRVQRLSLADDRLQLLGEPRRIYNDRGPNLNDLQLLPGGTHVTAFRRPHAKGKQWSLELIDLASGEVRVRRVTALTGDLAPARGRHDAGVVELAERIGAGRVLVERRHGAVELVTLSDAEVGRRETVTWREQLASDR